MMGLEKYTVAFPSVTHANKAKYELTRSGIPAKVIRTPRSLALGCGYSVAAEGKLEDIVKVLGNAGIHYKAIS